MGCASSSSASVNAVPDPTTNRLNGSGRGSSGSTTIGDPAALAATIAAAKENFSTATSTSPLSLKDRDEVILAYLRLMCEQLRLQLNADRVVLLQALDSGKGGSTFGGGVPSLREVVRHPPRHHPACTLHSSSSSSPPPAPPLSSATMHCKTDSEGREGDGDGKSARGGDGEGALTWSASIVGNSILGAALAEPSGNLFVENPARDPRFQPGLDGNGMGGLAMTTVRSAGGHVLAVMQVTGMRFSCWKSERGTGTGKVSRFWQKLTHYYHRKRATAVLAAKTHPRTGQQKQQQPKLKLDNGTVVACSCPIVPTASVVAAAAATAIPLTTPPKTKNKKISAPTTPLRATPTAIDAFPNLTTTLPGASGSTRITHDCSGASSGCCGDGISIYKPAAINATETLRLLAAHTVNAVTVIEQLKSDSCAFERDRYASLLELTQSLFCDLGDVQAVVTRIITQAADLIDCERCSVFLVDGDHLRPHVFDGLPAKAANATVSDMLLPKGSGVAGWVATSGQLLNIPNAYDDVRFNADVDRQTGYHTRCLLCMPIRSTNSDGPVIGVATLINKRHRKCFDAHDEATFATYAVFCGLALQAAQLHERQATEAYRKTIAIDCLSYHTRPASNDVARLRGCRPGGDNQWRDPCLLASFRFNSLDYSVHDITRAAIRMFYDRGLVAKFCIPHETLARWACCVRKSYRDVKYHNWQHGLGVGQFIFSCISCPGFDGVFSPLEELVLLIAGISHDLDHRGFNNAFEQKYETPLAKLYSTSTLENHHFDQALLILNGEGQNLLNGLNQSEYSTAIGMLKSAILATDLKLHLAQRGAFRELVASGNFDTNDSDHRNQLRSAIMTAADLSSAVKPFGGQQRVAELVYVEFFEQGDRERAMGTDESELMELLDRRKLPELPKMQLSFLNFMCVPVFTSLAVAFACFQPLVDAINTNRDGWGALQKAGPYTLKTPAAFLYDPLGEATTPDSVRI